MAITIQDQPTTVLVRPCFAPIDLLLTSTNTTEDGFKIVCKIYIATGSTLISTQQIDVIPSTTQAVFSIQDVVKSYVTSSYSIIDGDTVDVEETVLTDFEVTFQEYYDDALQGSVVTSNTFSSWYASPTYVQFAANNWQDWQVTTGDIDKEFLNAYSNQAAKWFGFDQNDPFLKVKDDQKYQISWLDKFSGVDANFQIWVKVMDDTYTNIQTTFIDLGAVNVGQFALDVGVGELASHTWDTAFTMTNVKYYALRLFDESTVDFCSDAILFEVDSCGTGYTPYELHWLNSKGGYDSMVFDGKSTDRTNISKTYAKYNNSKINGSVLEYKTSNQRTRPFHTGLTETF